MDFHDELLQFFTGLSHEIEEEGDLGGYNFTFSSTNVNRYTTRTNIQIKHRSGIQVEITPDFIDCTHWTEKGLQYYTFARFKSDEERFLQSLEQNVFSTECELAMKKAVKMLFLFIRDDTGLYDEDLYEQIWDK